MSFQCLELLDGTCWKGAAESSAQIPPRAGVSLLPPLPQGQNKSLRLGAKVTYFGLRLRRHLPGEIIDRVWDCRGALAASALSGRSPVSQVCSPSQTLSLKAQGEEETGNDSIRQSGSRFFGPKIKAYRDKS